MGHQGILDRKIQGNVHIEARGGANMSYAWQFARRPYMCYDVVVIMLGGNDISNGEPIPALVNEARRVARAFFTNHCSVQRVIFPSIWPRYEHQFNVRAQRYFDALKSLEDNHSNVTCWKWDWRQPWQTIDGVHLSPQGYEKAIKYLIAIIVWAAHRCNSGQ